MAITSTINTRPSAGASFAANLEQFLAEEDADRFDIIFSSFVSANGLHGTAGGLVGDPGSTIAFPAGFYVSETGTITYNDNTSHHWVIIYKDTTTVVGGDWIRVSGTHYLFDPVAAAQPTAPAGSLILMDVVTSGGAITLVTDLRNLTAFTVPEDVFKAKVSSDDTTSNYLLNKFASGTGITLTETDPGANETITIDSDGKTRITTNDTTRGFIQDKITSGDGIKETVQNSFGNEDLKLDIDLTTVSGLEFVAGQLQVNTVTNGGVALNANGVILDIAGTSETVSGLDTPDDSMIIEDDSQTGEKKREIKLSLLVPTGMTIPWIGTFSVPPPDAWVHANGNTIGNASSSATERANEDTEELFTLIYDSMANAQAAVSTGRGANAAADFAANKNIVIPNLQGRIAVGTGGTAMTTHGDNAGEETHVLIDAELSLHSHRERVGTTNLGGSPPINDASVYATVVGNNTFTHIEGRELSGGGTSGGGAETQVFTGDTGSDTAHENMPPWVSLSYIIKL